MLCHVGSILCNGAGVSIRGAVVTDLGCQKINETHLLSHRYHMSFQEFSLEAETSVVQNMVQ